MKTMKPFDNQKALDVIAALEPLVAKYPNDYKLRKQMPLEESKYDIGLTMSHNLPKTLKGVESVDIYN